VKRILVGFDGSDESHDALRLGNAFAELEGAKLIVAAVFSFDPLPLQANTTFAEAEAEYFKQRFDEAQSQLGHGFESRPVSWVSPAKALNDIAEGEQIDLIVIGSTHRGSVGRVFPGSVGERLLHGAPCAVAVAPRGFAQGQHVGIGLIGVAYDGTDEAKLALGEANRLSQQLDCQLRVITVVSTQAPGLLRAPYMELLRDHFRKVLDEAKLKLGETDDVEAVLEEGDPAAVLAKHGVELDLLVIGSRGYGPLRRTLLGGVSAEVMRTAPCPVVVVPRVAKAKSAPGKAPAAAAATE
jgi:nucleotide-binding universal stress UspA family protein